MFKKRKLGKIYREYLDTDLKLPRYKKVAVAMLVVVLAGFVGWVYEFIVACVESGTLTFRGGNFLPWMNIYAVGAIIVIPAVHRFRKNPALVFLIASLVAGIIELGAGWALFTFGDGTRFWNYNHGAWAFGSINGFVCPLSMAIFGVLTLLLVYLAIPGLLWVAQNLSKRKLLILAVTLFTLILVDEVTNQTLAALGKPTAREIYSSWGLRMDKS